jgi:Tfp pilus assembly protein PilO
MSATSTWTITKRLTAGALALLLAADIGLVVFLWRNSQQSPAEVRAQLDRLSLQAKLRRAEVARGDKIRASLSQVGKDCDQFYHDTFLDKASGYSALDADLGSIAAKAGLHMSGTNYKEAEVKGRGVTEISISTGVEGSYSSIIQFINGLEQSKNFYLLNDLHLTSAKAGAIKLELALRTYFRS